MTHVLTLTDWELKFLVSLLGKISCGADGGLWNRLYELNNCRLVKADGLSSIDGTPFARAADLATKPTKTKYQLLLESNGFEMNSSYYSRKLKRGYVDIRMDGDAELHNGIGTNVTKLNKIVTQTDIDALLKIFN